MTRLVKFAGILALVFGIGFTVNAQKSRPPAGRGGQNPPTTQGRGNEQQQQVEALRAEIKRLQAEQKRLEAALKLDRRKGDRDAAQHDQDQLNNVRERIKNLQQRIKDVQRGRGRL